MTCGEEIPEWLRNQIVGMRCAGKKYTEIERETIVNANTCQKSIPDGKKLEPAITRLE
jgi:hypothetical protein